MMSVRPIANSVRVVALHSMLSGAANTAELNAVELMLLS
jgi:hypothetical protein